MGQIRYKELKDGTASTCYEVPGGVSEAFPPEDDGVREWRAQANLKEASDTITRLFCKRCLVTSDGLAEKKRWVHEMERIQIQGIEIKTRDAVKEKGKEESKRKKRAFTKTERIRI